MAKKTAYDTLKQRGYQDTLAHRDVFEDQQLQRTKIEGKQSKTSRALVSAFAGLLVAGVIWVVASVAAMVIGMSSGMLGGAPIGVESPPFYERVKINSAVSNYCILAGPEGGLTQECYSTHREAQDNVPAWYGEHLDALAQDAAEAEAQDGEVGEGPQGPMGFIMAFGMLKLAASTLGGLGVFGILYPVLMRNLDAQNLMTDTSDINQYQGDQHIATPDEIMRKFDWFPDVGAHSDVQVSAMISHVMLTNKGLAPVALARRAEADTYDQDGELLYLKGEILTGSDDEPLTDTVPMIDEAFGDDLFESSGMPSDKTLRRKYDARKIEYNPNGSDRDKLGKYDTVADLINADWTLPAYEPQRPAGAFIVDTAPVNTMILAITRAGKGQTYIEPMIDMWLREKRPNNMVVNDPKGELLVKHYVRATMRGFQVVQFNLIAAEKTDIYNPLGMAADAAREGDATKCALYVENIADVFFPLDGGEDPVWPNAANNAFKRAAYGLIDYYLEEERAHRAHAARVGTDPKVLETELDELWGKVTLYNCYQLFVQLTAKKLKNPLEEVKADLKAGEWGDPKSEEFDMEGYELALESAEKKGFLWEDKPEADMLTLYFNACEAMPQNTMRTLIANANNALRSMGAAEKMLASVYGIAITAMSFFTDPTISTLTSGTPSQNTDLGGLSFPRRMGVRFSANYVKRDHLVGAQAVWEAYGDENFTQPLGSDFEHEDTVSREGWARYYFKGKFGDNVAYLKLKLVNAQSGMLIRTLYFQFTKDYQTSLNGRFFITDPITGEKIVKNGLLVELLPVVDEEATAALQAQTDEEHEKALEEYRKASGPPVTTGRGAKVDRKGAPPAARSLREAVDSGAPTRRVVEPVIKGYAPGHTTYAQPKLINVADPEPEKVMARAHAIMQTMVRYSEQPKVVFLVTPPHLMKYAKLILILVKQLVDLNFDKSYMTKSNQKPLYKTRFMLDELGNLQSEGHGISGFETMLSIGLGQEQQFTLILQTLQQLRDVYGESVDKIVQGNTSNIVFLKSTDDSMIDTLQKMSGTRHRSYIDSKTVTRDQERIVKGMNVEGKVSYTMSTKEEPVISYNDMAFISERNSIVFRAGDAPVWNRNETILPMSWRLFKDTIIHPGHEYSLQTIPTLSSALDFDVRMNQPDFGKMLAKRMEQAILAREAAAKYAKAYGYTEVDVTRLDPDVYSEQVMELVDAQMREEFAVTHGGDADEIDPDELEGLMDLIPNAIDDAEMRMELAARQSQNAEYTKMRYAGSQISREMLAAPDGSPRPGGLDTELVEAYKAARADMHADREHFSVDGNDALRSANGTQVFISRADESSTLQHLEQAAGDEGSRVFAEEPDAIKALQGYEVHPAFYAFLAKQVTWHDLARGEFDRRMTTLMRQDGTSLVDDSSAAAESAA